MSLSDDFVPGAAQASMFVHQMMINVLVERQIIPRETVLALLDAQLEVAERMQANAAAQKNALLEGAARGARFHIEALRTGLERLPLPDGRPRPPQTKE